MDNKSAILSQLARADLPKKNEFGLLHTFNVHSQSVTGIVLHEISGLAITSSLDGYLKVLNLESFTEMYSINSGGVPITSLKTIYYSGKMGCVYSLCDGTIKLLESTPCCVYFHFLTSNVEKFEKIQLNHQENSHNKPRRK